MKNFGLFLGMFIGLGVGGSLVVGLTPFIEWHCKSVVVAVVIVCIMSLIGAMLGHKKL